MPQRATSSGKRGGDDPRPTLKALGYCSVPNWHHDRLRRLLTLSEQAVLSEVSRQTLGWNATWVLLPHEEIAEALGIGANTVRSAVHSLLACGALVRHQDAEPCADKTRALGVQLDEASIEWEALEERKAGLRAATARQTAKAIEACRAQTSDGTLTSNVTLPLDVTLPLNSRVSDEQAYCSTVGSEGTVQREGPGDTQRSTDIDPKDSLRSKEEEGGRDTTPCAPVARPARPSRAARVPKPPPPLHPLAYQVLGEFLSFPSHMDNPKPPWKARSTDVHTVSRWILRHPGSDWKGYAERILTWHEDRGLTCWDLCRAMVNWLKREAKGCPVQVFGSNGRREPQEPVPREADRHSLAGRQADMRDAARRMMERVRSENAGIADDGF